LPLLGETCRVHRIANVLDKRPKRLQPKAMRALHEIIYAERRAACLAGIAAFVRSTGMNQTEPELWGSPSHLVNRVAWVARSSA
jgi:hypothetical protein